uniref:Uncharacterized protein n=1 Tax=Romanomermis culicivorax TaxID=13658 RepID=A0A915JQ78_ROMCU
MASPDHKVFNHADARDQHPSHGNAADSPPHVHFIMENDGEYDEGNDINDGDSGVGNGDELGIIIDSMSSSSDENDTMLTLSLMSGGNNSSVSNAANSVAENRPAPDNIVRTTLPPTAINNDGGRP